MHRLPKCFKGVNHVLLKGPFPFKGFCTTSVQNPFLWFYYKCRSSHDSTDFGHTSTDSVLLHVLILSCFIYRAGLASCTPIQPCLFESALLHISTQPFQLALGGIYKKLGLPYAVRLPGIGHQFRFHPHTLQGNEKLAPL